MRSLQTKNVLSVRPYTYIGKIYVHAIDLGLCVLYTHSNHCVRSLAISVHERCVHVYLLHVCFIYFIQGVVLRDSSCAVVRAQYSNNCGNSMKFVFASISRVSSLIDEYMEQIWKFYYVHACTCTRLLSLHVRWTGHRFLIIVGQTLFLAVLYLIQDVIKIVSAISSSVHVHVVVNRAVPYIRTFQSVFCDDWQILILCYVDVYCLVQYVFVCNVYFLLSLHA